MLKKVLNHIAASYLLILLVVIGLELFQVSAINRLNMLMDDFHAHPFTVINAAQEARSAITQLREKMQAISMTEDPATISRLETESLLLDQSLKSNMQTIKSLFLGDINKVNETEHLLEEWKTLRLNELDLARNRKRDAARKLNYLSFPRISTEISANMNYIIGFALHKANSLSNEARQQADAQIRLSWWLLAGLVAATATILWGISRRISVIVNHEAQMEQMLKEKSLQLIESTRQANRELEERVHQRTAELEAANTELEAFAYSVSHDLRAPLRAIDGFSLKLASSYGDRLDKEGLRILQVIRDNVLRMGKLIGNLLAFSRMGRQEISRQLLDMDAMVKSVVDELREAEPQRVMEFAISPLPRASADAALLRQVWVNLIGNACKFTGKNKIAHIEIGGSTTNGEAGYWVKDDGAGFDMQYAGRLFGVFQRLHRQDEFEGTGIGLANAQRILYRHGGRIWAEGKPGNGATFSFTLPLQTAGEAA